MTHHHRRFVSALACLLTLVTAASCSAYNNYTACAVPYNCGKFTDISFPFWGNHRPQQCGHPKFQLTCVNNTTTTIQIGNVTHTVLDVNQETHVLKIARTDLARSLCTRQLTNATLDPSLFDYAFSYTNLTLVYGCMKMNINLPVPYSFDCPVEGTSDRTSYVDFEPSLLGVNVFAGVYSCRVSVVVPVHYTELGELKDAEELVGKGFEVRFKVGIHGLCGKCENSGGRCGYGYDEEFVCFCQNGTAARGGTCDGGSSAAHRVGGGGASAVVVQLPGSGNVYMI